ncbi:MAG TPA: amidohydrolase family protein [Marinobacter sp.]|uniref:metal-dependent hydrolase family protein n=1 Tax=Marinobacter sp. TaxID=50741 RepID=UPI00262A4068|nr:amidohydrolase family protein [Marinobacter sp.]HET8801133.1 amidohydrolase family protein [Marinobacter sp.]
MAPLSFYYKASSLSNDHSHGGCQCGSPLLSRFHERMMADINRREFIGGMAGVMAMFVGLHAPSVLSEKPKGGSRPLLLKNLKLFDGTGGPLRHGTAVRVKNGRIEAIVSSGIDPGDAEVIDCEGRVVMPGLIDAHWHTTLAAISQVEAMTSDAGYVHLVAAREAERTLMRGVTSVRDVGGPAFALKKAIDKGIVSGPRIFPAGAMISQTSGHGDFRMRREVPRGSASPLSEQERQGVAAIADGEAEVLRRTREQLMLGASQIKLMAGGGVASVYDPLDSTQFTERELRAAVDAAGDWGTYVAVHVYTPRGIQRALRVGVKSIEHGQLADEESVRMMAGEGAWWSLQPFLQDEDSNVYPDAERRESQRKVAEGTVRAYEMAQRFDVKTAWGTDILFSPQNTHNQLRHLAKLTRFYDPLTALAMATGHNGELLALSGPRAPYSGTLGRIEPGALADLLVVDGDPEKTLDFLNDPDNNLRLIMKGGHVHKNSLPGYSR